MSDLYAALDQLHAAGQSAPCEHPVETFAWVSDARSDRRYAAMECRRSCPVMAECLAHALATDTRYHVWGGQDFTSPGLAECGTKAGYNAHRREGTTPCTPCRLAVAEYQRTAYHQRKGATTG